MITYLIKSIICSGLLLSMFYLFLEKEKMHRFNRFYLLGAFIFSWIVPLVTFKIKAPAITEKIQPVITSTIFAEQPPPSETLMNTSIQQASYNYVPMILWVIYAGVTFALLVRFIINLYCVRKLLIKNPVEKYKEYSLVIIPENTVSFSFFRYIFPAAGDYQNGKMNKEIFLHESVHARELHSLDILFIELVKASLWINPFVFLYKKAIQLNHEFIADDVVVSKNNISNYQQLLLSKIIQTPLSQLVSSSNYSITKKRFIMMTKKTKPIKALWLKLSIIPVTALICFLFAQTKVEAKTIPAPEIKSSSVFQDTTTQGISQAEFNDYQTAVKKALVTRRNGMKDVSFTKIGGGSNMNKYAHLYERMSPEQKKKAVFAIKLAPPPPPPPKKFTTQKVVKDTTAFLPVKVLKTENSVTPAHQVPPPSIVYTTDSLHRKLTIFDSIINGKEYICIKSDGQIYVLPGDPKHWFVGIGPGKKTPEK